MKGFCCINSQWCMTMQDVIPHVASQAWSQPVRGWLIQWSVVKTTPELKHWHFFRKWDVELRGVCLWFQLYHVEHRIISLATFVYPSVILSDQIPPELYNYTRKLRFFSKSYPRWMTRCFLEFALAPLPRNENWDVGMHLDIGRVTL